MINLNRRKLKMFRLIIKKLLKYLNSQFLQIERNQISQVKDKDNQQRKLMKIMIKIIMRISPKERSQRQLKAMLDK